MRARTHFRGGLASIVVCLAALPAFAQSGDEAAPEPSPLARQHEAAVRARYGHAGWARGELRAGLASSLELPGFVRGALQSDRGLLTRTFRRPDAKQPSFVLETLVAGSVDAAHEMLLTWLAGLQSDRLVPRAAEVGLDVGDVGFVGHSGAGPKAVAWVAFARGNVAVRVSAFDPRREPDLDLGAIARRVDEAIVAEPPLPAGASVRAPEIPVLVAERSAAVAGDRLRLDLSLVDPGRGEPHVQWVVGGPGQGYVERSDDGVYRLFTTGPGRITLAVEVTGSTGTFARRSIELEVADD